ncbi:MULTISPECIES: rhodanese-like domain-containing protein [unclassified Lysobacter]|uniref:rhodanese-like domain-containing protein n=1 Tax=unclassified Lysobacter TaxID=2635362 RepID=UPI001C215460|nr:rhodanese-like domain-containing protein [Lysobacter sp. MMG2]MBU8975694.1 rhodanese-like domain-containing protein [Lysobacter sp. MMG2]
MTGPARHRKGPLLAATLCTLAFALALPTSAIAATTCPLAAAQAPASPSQAPLAPEDRTCLIDARALGAKPVLYDLRSRSDYASFHIPDAQHASVAEVSRLLRDRPGAVVLYDGGKFRSDAFLLCKRLRDEGLKNFRIIDGGIAAWAQVQRRAERLEVSRLSDAEVSAALSDRNVSAVALSDGYAPVLSEHRIRQATKGSTGRKVLIADTFIPSARLEASLDGKGGPVLYWTGDRDRLVALIHTHLRQDQKRTAGPAQSTACSAL